MSQIAKRPRHPGRHGRSRVPMVNGSILWTQENITETAKGLGVSRVTLYRMLRRHEISLNRGLKSAPGRADLERQSADQSRSSTG